MTDNLQIVRNFWSALFSRDPARIEDAVAEDVEWIAPPGNATAVALGVTHHMIGPKAICRFILDDVRRLFSNGIEVEVLSITAGDDRVIFEQRQTALLANGRNFDLIYVFIFEVAGGRVRQVREYMDTHKGHRMVFGDQEPRQIV